MAGNDIYGGASGGDRETMGESITPDLSSLLGEDKVVFNQLVRKMNVQAGDPALMPHLARPGVLNPEPYGGANGGLRVPMPEKPLDPSAGMTLANSKLLHPSNFRSAVKWYLTGDQGE